MNIKNVGAYISLLTLAVAITACTSGKTDTPSDAVNPDTTSTHTLSLSYPTSVLVAADGTVSLPIGIQGITNGDVVRGVYVTLDAVPDYLRVADLDEKGPDYISYKVAGWTGSSNLVSDPVRSRIMISMQGPNLSADGPLMEIAFSVEGDPTNASITIPAGVTVGGGYFSVCESPCENPATDLKDIPFEAGTIQLQVE